MTVQPKTKTKTDYIVETKAQLVAALKAAAQPTFEVAKKHPFTVRWGSTRYTFKEGVSEIRLKQILANVARKPTNWAQQ